MNNLKKKNKSISTSQDFNISQRGLTCIGPCYPPNTVFYHPLYFRVLESADNEYVCPIERNEIEGEVDIVDKCEPGNNTYNPKTFDIFEDVVQIANTPKLFLKQIYGITNIEECIKYLNDDFDANPVYSQKRIVNAIIQTWIKNPNFPLQLISYKVKYILEKIYKIDVKIEKISKKISDINDKQNYTDIFDYFLNKSKKK